MVFQHVWGLLSQPAAEWAKIRDRRCSISGCFSTHISILALIPALAGYIGITQVGWQFGSQTVKLDPDNAITVTIVFYLAMLFAVLVVGKMIDWMSQTYDVRQPLSQSIALSAYTATPLFLAGVFQLNPIVWLNFLIGLPVIGYTVYLLYTGLPIMMEIPEEKGFVFSSAVLGAGLVIFVGLLAALVFLWIGVINPTFSG
ncbi:MAG: YIP1 family protein [Gammaproteobacteria bacterium]|nr:YIP1 family protein [Gammaproteobacteria bacterium]MCB1736751.1 YIP1 family protein [Gammaproteobacteria bacterium]MCP5137011.1 YIP1 family protein [Gammaproteobacteria bacterium]